MKEGNTVLLAERHTLSFQNRRIIQASTPKVDAPSFIGDAFAAGDRGLYHVCRVGCGRLTPIAWKDIEWPEGRPELAYFRCPACGARVGEQHKRAVVEAGRWIATIPRLEGMRIRRAEIIADPFRASPLWWALNANQNFVVFGTSDHRLLVHFADKTDGNGGKSSLDWLQRHKVETWVTVTELFCGVDAQPEKLVYGRELGVSVIHVRRDPQLHPSRNRAARTA
jgi:hypothetical protein